MYFMENWQWLTKKNEKDRWKGMEIVKILVHKTSRLK